VTGQPDLACPVCSKSVLSGSLVLLEHGELFHIQCRSQTLQLAVLDQIDRGTVMMYTSYQAPTAALDTLLTAGRRSVDERRGKTTVTPSAQPLPQSEGNAL
jgi:hypothetical protein